MSVPAVELHELRQRYGDRIALDGISLTVARGEIMALLGPNGSGKSTLFRILATLLEPTQGSARIFGHDVRREADAVRRRVGVVFQQPSIDKLLSVEENLLHHGALYGLARGTLRVRVAAMLERFGLAERRDERVGRLSGGLARRVELAKALVVGAEVLLLDEPSTGLDPLARREFLAHLAELRERDGITVLLTTHHLDEAERADHVAILDRGRLVTLGAPEELKAALGGDVLVMQVASAERLRERLRLRLGLEAAVVDGALRLEAPRAHEIVSRLVDAFPDEIRSITYGKPTLEDVFVHLTGRRFEAAGTS
ncbi:MAG TPA: ABC transporter ATP-binding protein [Candidatus Nitrosopolaris sp.]|nr:ABC transporter ATP-binding protein [Candidatus Nitrosopolaris sp.]